MSETGSGRAHGWETMTKQRSHDEQGTLVSAANTNGKVFQDGKTRGSERMSKEPAGQGGKDESSLKSSPSSSSVGKGKQDHHSIGLKTLTKG